MATIFLVSIEEMVKKAKFWADAVCEVDWFDGERAMKVRNLSIEESRNISDLSSRMAIVFKFKENGLAEESLFVSFADGRGMKRTREDCLNLARKSVVKQYEPNIRRYPSLSMVEKFMNKDEIHLSTWQIHTCKWKHGWIRGI